MNKIEAINQILEESSKNIIWNHWPYNQIYHVWEASTEINGDTYTASYRSDNMDSAKMVARTILKNIKRDLAGQLFDKE